MRDNDKYDGKMSRDSLLFFPSFVVSFFRSFALSFHEAATKEVGVRLAAASIWAKSNMGMQLCQGAANMTLHICGRSRGEGPQRSGSPCKNGGGEIRERGGHGGFEVLGGRVEFTPKRAGGD